MEKIKMKVNEIVYDILKENIQYEDMTPDKILVDDLQAESVDILEIVLSLITEFNITIEFDDAKNMRTLKDIYEFIYKKNQQVLVVAQAS